MNNKDVDKALHVLGGLTLAELIDKDNMCSVLRQNGCNEFADTVEFTMDVDDFKDFLVSLITDE